jgi:hypothetical protein
VRDSHAAIAPQRAKRKWGKRRRLVGAACTGLFITALPLAFASCFLCQLLNPLQLLLVSLLSSQPFSWGLRLREQVQGDWHAWSSFENHPQNHYRLIYHFKFSSERAPRINKNFRYLAK